MKTLREINPNPIILLASLVKFEICCYYEYPQCYNWNDKQMWRDILIILAFVFAGLTYFGLTPGRLSRYTRTARTELTKRTPLQKGRLIFAIALSLVYIYMLAGGLIEFSLEWSLRLTSAFGVLWRLKEKRGEKVFIKVIIVATLVFVPLFIASYALGDMPLLKKIAYPAATIGIGCVSGMVRAYIERKRESRQPCKEEDK